MFEGYYVAHFIYSDPYLSVVDTDSIYDDIINRAKKLCEVFDFDFNLEYASVDESPNVKFTIGLTTNFLTYQHYLNVLQAFAQEFQLTIESVFEEKV